MENFLGFLVLVLLIICCSPIQHSDNIDTKNKANTHIAYNSNVGK